MSSPVDHLLLCGFSGTSLPDRLRRLLARGVVGGVVLFRRNVESPEQLARLTRAIYEAARDEPPWIAVDQEGGRVQRLRAPLTELPPAALLGPPLPPAEAAQFGRIIGEEAAATGCNLVFAPVVDLRFDHTTGAIGDRALGGDPHAVAERGLALARGLRDGGVMPCGKHFPGHGRAEQDSHLTLPHIAADRATLEATDWVPFRALVEGRVPALMTAHVVLDAIDPVRPASLSSLLLDELLRRRWGFGGLLFSDDLEMGAIAHSTPFDRALIEGLLCGVDQFLICSDLDLVDEAYDVLRVAWDRGALPGALVDASRRRRQRVKRLYARPYRGLSPGDMAAFVATRGGARARAQRWFRLWRHRCGDATAETDPTERPAG